RNLRRSVVSHEPYADRSARGRVFDRISDEIHEQLFDARLVAPRGDARGGLDREDMAPLLERRIDVALHDFADKDGEVIRDSLHKRAVLSWRVMTPATISSCAPRTGAPLTSTSRRSPESGRVTKKSPFVVSPFIALSSGYAPGGIGRPVIRSLTSTPSRSSAS